MNIFISRLGEAAEHCGILYEFIGHFFLTGIWHGAGWNYILWGSIHGILVVIERIIQNRKFYKQMPIFIKYIGTMLSVMLLWQCFRYQSLREVMKLFGIILGIVQFDKIYYTWLTILICAL